MSALISYNIEGVGVQPVSSETVSPELSAAFASYLNQIETVWQKKVTDPNYSYTAADYTAINQAIASLDNLAANGFVDSKGVRWRINFQMAKYLDVLLKSFTSVNFSAAAGNTQNMANAVSNWWVVSTQDTGQVDQNGHAILANPTLDNTVTMATLSGTSIQSIIEVDYVKAANDLISQQLTGLETALQSTQQAISALTDIQNIYNKVAPADPGNYKNTMNATNFALDGQGWLQVGRFDLSGGAASNDKSKQPVWASQYQSLAENGIPSYGMNNYNISVQGTVEVSQQAANAYINAHGGGVTGALHLALAISANGGSISGTTVTVTNSDGYLLDGSPGAGGKNLMQFLINNGLITSSNYPPFAGFNNPISATSTLTQADIDSLNQYRTSGLQTLIDQISSANGFIQPGSAAYNALTPSQQQAALAQWTGSLPDKLNQLLQSMNTAYSADNTNWTSNWVVDNIGQNPNNSGARSTGSNGAALSAAQVAAQSINDQQKENVQKTLFLFQEFYKSASGILTTMSQLIARIAQAYSR